MAVLECVLKSTSQSVAKLASAILLISMLGSALLAKDAHFKTLEWTVPCPLDDCKKPLKVVYEDAYLVPLDAQAGGFPVGGLSGIDVDSNGDLIAISDDRSEKGPARLIKFRVRLARSGKFDLLPNGVVILHNRGGQPFLAQSIDPESVRSLGNGTFVISSEGISDSKINPSVFQFTSEGTFVRELELPSEFQFSDQPETGSRKNLSLEGLARLSQGRLVAISESSLFQDGPMATSIRGSRNRVVEFEMTGGNSVGQYLYQTDPVERRPTSDGSIGERGVSEIVGLRGRQVLVLEREVYPGQHFEAALYIAELPTPSQEMPTLRKTKLFDFREAGLNPDNLEGMAVLRDRWGRTHLLVCSDNNFSPKQVNQFLLFRIEFPGGD